jgi:hypothetical protein
VYRFQHGRLGSGWYVLSSIFINGKSLLIQFYPVCIPISGVSKAIEPACSFDTPCVTFNFDYEGNTWFQRKFVPTCDRANNECQSVGFGITWAQLHPLVETVSCNLWTSTDCSGNYQHIGDGATTLDQHNPKRSFKCCYNC